jgi:hypothetical protein
MARRPVVVRLREHVEVAAVHHPRRGPSEAEIAATIAAPYAVSIALLFDVASMYSE